ncbi:MAG: N-acetyltransferase family protein [Tannerellaceae bacterium]|nr:N-acetyltransferase family protein [Tannerellaceae bacterium]
MHIRNVLKDDAPEICRIYNYYIENTCISFETEPVSAKEMETRIQDVLNAGFPYYVAEVNNKIVGYVYIHTWHSRRAYDTTKEMTIYLDKDERGHQYGTKLYEYLLSRINTEDTHVLIAGITIPNDASVKLHEKFGFRQVSHFKEVGYKFNEWRDVGHWQLILSK